jgi:hypothetical protein
VDPRLRGGDEFFAKLSVLREVLMRTFVKPLVVISQKLSVPGIFLANNHCNPVLQKDSGQAGMTEFGQGSFHIQMAIFMNSIVDDRGE